MEKANFVDYVKICCRSGAGGAGTVHFRREKFAPFGGPDGGNGGQGGSIILRGNKQLWTLLHLKYRKHVIAEAGKNGAKSRASGISGKDVILEVPLGTIARDAETGEQHCEIVDDGQTVVLVQGGQGGMGNAFFKSSVNQTPRYAQPGGDGKSEWKILELKLLADIGLVGFPNAGKSTLLSVVSAATPKVANYPFTTLVPNLGIVSYREDLSFVMADIPGIIKDAHKGKGLGHRFLRHIERNASLLFMVPSDSPNIKEEYEVLLNECREYNPELLDKTRILAITKADLADEEMRDLLRAELPENIEKIFISSITGEGITALKDLIWQAIIAEVDEPVRTDDGWE